MGIAKYRSSTGGSRKFFRNSKAQDAPVEEPGSPREEEGADGTTLKRASRGNMHRNERKALGPKRENILDPLGSLFTINKKRNQGLVSVTLSQRRAPPVLSGLQLATSELTEPTHRDAGAAQTDQGKEPGCACLHAE